MRTVSLLMALGSLVGAGVVLMRRLGPDRHEPEEVEQEDRPEDKVALQGSPTLI